MAVPPPAPLPCGMKCAPPWREPEQFGLGRPSGSFSSHWREQPKGIRTELTNTSAIALDDFFTAAILLVTRGTQESRSNRTPHSLNAQVETPQPAAKFVPVLYRLPGSMENKSL